MKDNTRGTIKALRKKAQLKEFAGIRERIHCVIQDKKEDQIQGSRSNQTRARVGYQNGLPAIKTMVYLAYMIYRSRDAQARCQAIEQLRSELEFKMVRLPPTQSAASMVAILRISLQRSLDAIILTLASTSFQLAQAFPESSPVLDMRRTIQLL